MRKLTLVAVAIASALTTSLTFSPQAFANQVMTNQQNQNVSQSTAKLNIPAGNLGDALVTLSKITGKSISVDANLIQGMNSPKLSGRYSAEQAINKLIANLPLQLKVTTANSLTLIAKPKNQQKIGTLATAIVESTDIKDGSAADGYRTDEISSVGPWQGRTLQETPYSINVVSESLIQNLQATSADQIYKLNPVMQFTRPTTQNDNAEAAMRGFKNSTTARDGISRQKWNYSHGVLMEETASVEILTGLSGFIYGAGNIGGTINYVTKKPTAERLNSITVGNTSGSNVYLHGDFGGQFDDEGTFGYRVNLVSQDGETHIKNQNLKRNSVSLAFDWQVNDDLLIGIDGNIRDYELDGRQPYWSLGKDASTESGLVARPDAKDLNSDTLWGQQWTTQYNESHRLGANVHWNINDYISFRAAILDEKITRVLALPFNKVQVGNTYDRKVKNNVNAPQDINGSGGFAFIDIAFETGSLSHKLTTGWQLSKSDSEQAADGWSKFDSEKGLSLSAPIYVTEPQWSEHGSQEKIRRNRLVSTSFSLGDDITFNDQWSALIGFSHTELTLKKDPRKDPAKTNHDTSETTPSLSVMYKPADFITTYASYIEGFELGGIAKEVYGGEDVVNAFEVMEPLVSTQIELGAKAEFAGMLFTTALFEIDKPFEYYQAQANGQYIFVQDGRQVHRGLEFTATGKATENLTLVGGFTLLDAKSEDNADLAGMRPRDVAETLIKLYGEYDLSAVPGLVITGGFSYTGDFYGDNKNTDKIDAYTLLDLGARYQQDIAGQDVTLRLNINNLTDKQYWANNWFIGDGRTVSLSANVIF